MTRGFAYIAILAVATGCAQNGRLAVAPTPVAEPAVVASWVPLTPSAGGPSAMADASCAGCAANSLTPEESRVLEKRIADLKAKGGNCSSYGAVLERSYRGGQITIRPYMWRVGSQLTSGEARADGAMILAREIDSLNAGLRKFDELVWTMEHEAAHIAFNLNSGRDAGVGDRANDYVRACRS